MFKYTKDYYSILAGSADLDKLLIIVGPSSVGKSTLIDKLMTEYPDKFAFAKTHTTKVEETQENNTNHSVICSKEDFLDVYIQYNI